MSLPADFGTGQSFTAADENADEKSMRLPIYVVLAVDGRAVDGRAVGGWAVDGWAVDGWAVHTT